MSVKVDVLISGAGPVGLFFAYQMAQRGHSVYIVDQKPGPTDQSRAILITARTLEILESKGLAADILRESYVLCGMRMFQDGAIVGQMDACGDTAFAHNTILMQGKTEEVISQRIKEDTDSEIHWETELVSYTQDQHGVKSVIRDMNTKQEQVIESTYIVGADGSHSRVRKGNPQWTYDGVAIQTRFVLADLTLHGADGQDIKFLMDRMNLFTHGTDMLGLVRLNPVHASDDDSHVFRIFGNLDSYHISQADQNKVSHGIDKTAEGPPTLEFIENWLNKAVAPLKFVPSNIIWASYFKINERMANGFRKDRAFLIGDAAHCHSPAGGQGMNLGLQDAHNLAWKMSDVLNGFASDPEKLLDSYNEEREPIVKETIEFTRSTTKVGLQGSALFASLRNTMLALAMKIPSIREKAYNRVMQLNLALDPQTSSIMKQKSDHGLIEAGHFLPDTATLRKSYVLNTSKRPRRIERFSLRDILVDNSKYTVVLVATCFPSTKPNVHLMEKFWNDTRSKPIRRIIVQSSHHLMQMSKLPEYVTDQEASVAEESFYSEERIFLPNSVSNTVGLYPILNSYFAGQQASSVVLFVRPDLYVSHAKLVANETELESALEFLSTLYK